MFCACNETLQSESSIDQSHPQCNSTESDKPTSVSGPALVSDVVVVSDDEGTTGLLRDQTHVHNFNQSSGNAHSDGQDAHSDGLDCDGIPLSNFESSHDSSRYFKLESREGYSSEETRVCETDSFLDQNRSDTAQTQYPDTSEMTCDLRLLQDRSGCEKGIADEASLSDDNRVSVINLSFDDHSHEDLRPESSDDGNYGTAMPFGTEAVHFRSRSTGSQNKEGSLFSVSPDHDINCFFEQKNRKDRNPRKCSTDFTTQSSFEPLLSRPTSLEDNERQRFLFTGTQVQEPKCPDENFREHFANDDLGLGLAVEPSAERLRYPASKDSEKRLFNFGTEDWSARSVLERLQPDDEPPPVAKRLRTCLSGAAHPAAKKHSSSGYQCEEPVTSERAGTSVLAETQPAAKTSSLRGGCGVPVEKSVRTEELLLPSSRVYSARSVSLVQSEKGMRMITEDTVAHTIFDRLSPESETPDSRNGPHQSLSIGYYNTKNHKNGNNATTSSSDCSTKFMPDGLDEIQANSRIPEVILSPCENSTAVVTRAPSKTSYSIGRTDRADIAGGWKPVCGQMVARKPARPSQNPILSTSESIRKTPQLCRDSLWTTFDNDAKKSKTHAQLMSGQERFGMRENDEEPVLASSASRFGVCGKSGNPVKDSLALSLVNSSTPSDRRDPAHGRPPVMAASSVGEDRDWSRVESMTRQCISNQHGTFRMPATSVKNSVDVCSRNSSEPVMRFEPGTAHHDHLLPASSYGRWIESATVDNMLKKKTSGSGASTDCGAGIDCGAVEIPSRTIIRPNADGFPACRFGLAAESSFGKRSEPVRIANVERKSSSSGDGQEDGVSKWHRFQEIADMPHHQQPPVRSSTMARTTIHHPFQAPLIQPTSSDLVQTATQPVRAQTALSSAAVNSTMQSPFHCDVQPSRKPEVACVTPQVRQPLRALQRDHNTAAGATAHDGIYCQLNLIDSVSVFLSIFPFSVMMMYFAQ